jgi:hypothetical protein
MPSKGERLGDAEASMTIDDILLQVSLAVSLAVSLLGSVIRFWCQILRNIHTILALLILRDKALWSDGEVAKDKVLTSRWMRQFAHTWRHFSFWRVQMSLGVGGGLSFVCFNHSPHFVTPPPTPQGPLGSVHPGHPTHMVLRELHTIQHPGDCGDEWPCGCRAVGSGVSLWP